jgi:hypothetical protein
MSGVYDPFKERVVREIAERLCDEVDHYLAGHVHQDKNG